MHLSHVCPCSSLLPAGFYWYGGNRRCPGRVPQLIDRLLQDSPLGPVPEEDNQDTGDSELSLSVPDEDPTEDDQPIDVTPRYSLRDYSTIVPPARLMTAVQDELLPGEGGVGAKFSRSTIFVDWPSQSLLETFRGWGAQ